MKRPQPPERLLNIDPLDNVDFEPAKELVEADAARSHFCVKQAAVLAQLLAQCGHMPTF